jgi:hypothetical protein
VTDSFSMRVSGPRSRLKRSITIGFMYTITLI